MKVSFLNGPSLAAKLPMLMASCTQLDIAMAYVKIGALRTLIKNADRLLGPTARIRIVFGLSSKQGITDKDSAKLLLELSKRKNIAVKKLDSPRFHPKLFIFHGHHPHIVVCSANLTKAAQSGNIEANLLVENADSQLYEETLRFFEHYFCHAPILTQNDVGLYRPRLPRTGRGFRNSSKEDDIPFPFQIRQNIEKLRPRMIWKISPGADACYWKPEWVKAIDDDGEGFIALGWSEVGNLENFKSHEYLKKAVTHKAETIWDVNSDKKTKIKYATDQLWAFKNSIKDGDVVIVYSETRVFGLAQVTGESKYHFRKMESLTYGHQINVKYWWFREWPRRADDKIVKVLGKQGTLRLVEEDWLWDYLVKKLL